MAMAVICLWVPEEENFSGLNKLNGILTSSRIVSSSLAGSSLDLQLV